MTEFLVWREGWLLHIDPLDADHKEMVRLLNLLASSETHTANAGEKEGSADKKDTPATESLLSRFDALISHIRDHFAREEAFMESINYPGCQEHKREHTVQMAVFTALRRDLSNSGAETLEREDLQGIKMWFLDHVFGEDRHYADFYQKNPH